MGASPTQYSFISGFDFSALTEITNTQLIQAINLLGPRDNIGGIIVLDGDGGNNWPGVVNNPRFVDYIWIDTDTSPPVLKVNQYAGNRVSPGSDLYSDWSSATIADGGVTTAKLAAAAVTLAKIQHTEGAARSLLRVNAADTAVEWIAPNSIFSTDEINISALDDSAAANESYLRRGSGGLMEFQTKSNLAASVQALIANLALNQLDLTGVANGDIIRIAGGVPGWAALTPALLQAGGASADQELAYNGANWVPRASPLKSYVELTPGTDLTTTFPASVGHGLGVKPRIVMAYAVCVTDEFGYVAGDEVPLSSIFHTYGSTGANDWPLTWDATNIYYGIGTEAGQNWNSIRIYSKTDGGEESLTESSWNFKFRCFA